MLPRFPHSRLTIAALLAAAACTAGGRPVPGAAAPAETGGDREPRLSAALGPPISVSDLPTADSLPAGRTAAHRALVAAYTELGVPATVADPATGLVAALELRVRGRIGATRASRFVSCGSTRSGERADEDRLVLTAVSRLRASGPSTSRVETRVVAAATDPGGTGTRQACTTTGELETRLHEAAKRALRSPS